VNLLTLSHRWRSIGGDSAICVEISATAMRPGDADAFSAPHGGGRDDQLRGTENATFLLTLLATGGAGVVRAQRRTAVASSTQTSSATGGRLAMPRATHVGSAWSMFTAKETRSDARPLQLAAGRHW
jgi:hypothetical protein